MKAIELLRRAAMGLFPSNLSRLGFALCVAVAGLSSAAGGAQVASPPSGAKTTHWAFQAVSHPSVPVVHQADLVRSPVDAFLLEQLESHGLTYSAAADKRDLIRRAKFDLLGLPPTPDEVE